MEKGYFIEDGKVVSAEAGKPFMLTGSQGDEYETNACLERARNPEIDNDNTVYWTKEGAEDALLLKTDPVNYWLQKFKADEIDKQEFVQLVGRGPARKAGVLDG